MCLRDTLRIRSPRVTGILSARKVSMESQLIPLFSVKLAAIRRADVHAMLLSKVATSLLTARILLKRRIGSAYGTRTRDLCLERAAC